MTDGAGKEGHDAQGRFAAGNPGGPGGARPRRSTELRRAVEEAISPEHLQAMIRKAARLGLEGNLPAMRLVFERTCGRAAEAPVDTEPLSIALPPMATAADCNLALQRVTDAICKGAIDLQAAKVLIDAVQTRLKAIETTELEARLAELEALARNVDHPRRPRIRR